MSEVPKKIITYLLGSFRDVESIILHGSRAAGFAREHSDWDFIVLSYTQQQQEYFRHEIDGMYFEYQLYTLPIDKDDIFRVFNTKLQFSQLVFDKQHHGAKLLQDAQGFYRAGIPQKFLSQDFKEYRKKNRMHIVDTLRDVINDSAMFMKKLGLIYPQIINEWYWFKKREYPKNLYISIPQIANEDIWFSRKLEIVYMQDYSFQEKINALDEMIAYIYE